MSQFSIFNQHKDVHYDACYIEASDLMDQAIVGYNTNNFFQGFCQTTPENNKGNKNDIDAFAMENGMVLNNGYGNTNLCDMTADSDLKYRQLTNDKNKQQLFQRIFKSVPNLNHGGLVTETDSRLTQGEDTRIKRSCNVLSGVSTLENQFIPQISCISSTIQDPNYIIFPNPHNQKSYDGRVGADTRGNLLSQCPDFTR